MTRRGYIPLAVETAQFVFAAHLPGISAAVAGFTIGELRVSKLTWGECRLLEKSRFMDDLQDVYFSGNEPFFLVFCGYPDSDQARQSIESQAVEAIRRVTRALRLLVQGKVWDPLDFILYTRRGTLNERNPRTFGRLPFQMRSKIELTSDDIEQLDGLYDALLLFDRCRFDREIDRAEALLGASFSPAHLTVAHEMLPLLGAIEILSGGNLAPLSEAAWADEEMKGRASDYRSFRNALSHGRREEEEKLRQSAEFARHLVRILIREALIWRLLEPQRESVVGPELIDRVCAAETVMPDRLAQLQVPFASLDMSPGHSSSYWT